MCTIVVRYTSPTGTVGWCWLGAKTDVLGAVCTNRFVVRLALKQYRCRTLAGSSQYRWGKGVSLILCRVEESTPCRKEKKWHSFLTLGIHRNPGQVVRKRMFLFNLSSVHRTSIHFLEPPVPCHPNGGTDPIQRKPRCRMHTTIYTIDEPTIFIRTAATVSPLCRTFSRSQSRKMECRTVCL